MNRLLLSLPILLFLSLLSAILLTHHLLFRPLSLPCLIPALLLLVLLTRLLSSDPGRVSPLWSEQQSNSTVPPSPTKRYCFKCSLFKPERTHHCQVCGRCVLKMDHHCPFLGVCIGKNNYKLFINLLVNLNVLLSSINYRQCSGLFSTLFSLSSSLGWQWVATQMTVVAVVV